MVRQGDFYPTTCGGKILGTEKTVEEPGLEDWEEVVAAGEVEVVVFPVVVKVGLGELV